jgi:hypothetical protein
LINESVEKNKMKRKNFWPESIAVCDNSFVVHFKKKQADFNNILNNSITWQLF